MTAPTHCPPRGLCLSVAFVRARDGDTIEVSLPGGALVFAVRLVDCWAPELRRGTDAERRKGYEALEYARQVCEAADPGDLRLHIPLPEGDVRGVNPLKWITFDRIPGYLYVGGSRTLNEMLVAAGLASTSKGGELGT